MVNQRCSVCGKKKLLINFHKHRHTKTGYAYRCKPCVSKLGKKYRSTLVGVFSQIRARNKHYDDHPFNISQEDFVEWYGSQDRICVYCGLLEDDLKHIDDNYNKKSLRLSVDCVNNEGGYKKGNLVLACHRCNAMKSDLLTFDEMRFFGETYVQPKWEKQLGRKLHLPRTNSKF